MSQGQNNANLRSRNLLIPQIKKKLINLDEGEGDMVKNTSLINEKIDFFFNSVTRVIVLKDYVKDTECFFLIYDSVKFADLKQKFNWVELWKKEGVWVNPKVKFFLVSNKKDIISKPLGSNKKPQK
ncbi:MAG: hypothetical protein ACTSYU_09720 [Promethearchaeota archaeon]